MSFKRNEMLTASEVARYVYCKRAWSYDRLGKIREKKKPSPAVLLFSLSCFVLMLAVVGWITL